MNQRPRTIEEQVSLLRAKGMEFEDLNEAKTLLSRISYFRLKYFWTDLIDESSDGDFLPDTSFDMVMKRYNFDHNLRLVLFDAIEMIEVAFRAKIINHMSKAAGNGLWYLDASLFEDADRHQEFVLNLKYEFEISTEPFAKKYIENHPNWQ
ncbi:MAG: Abi family protein, partial [Bacteroidaceae bacterium]|nr:Abi family protein [Bacteroidaceae bacterium]